MGENRNVGKNEKARGQIDQKGSLSAVFSGNLIRYQHQEGIPDQIVVEGPQELGDEKRQKAP